MGCLLAAACGDALGKAAEFLPLETVRSRFAVLHDFRPVGKLAAGNYTDDTVLMLALADSIINRRGIDPADVAASSVRWWKTPPKRGYGPNTLSALQRLDAGEDWQNTAGDMPSNGGAMRIAPVGIVCMGSNLIEESKNAIRWSHRNERAQNAAILMAAGVQQLMRGMPFPFYHPEIEKRCSVVGIDATDEEVIRGMITPNQFGNNFAIDANEAVCLAAWCFMANIGEPESAIIRAVNLGGDADTIGCMVGALCGACYGWKWLPDRWLSKLENRELIGLMGESLAEIQI